MLLSGDARMLTLRLSVPSLLAMLSTGLCTLLDALYAARAGAALSGAMSVCFPLLTLIQTVGFTLGMGAGSHVSRCLGTDDRQSARQASSTAAALALALGLLLAAAGVFFLLQQAVGRERCHREIPFSAQKTGAAVNCVLPSARSGGAGLIRMCIYSGGRTHPFTGSAWRRQS